MLMNPPRMRQAQCSLVSWSASWGFTPDGVSAGHVRHFNSGVKDEWECVCDWLAQGLPNGINP